MKNFLRAIEVWVPSSDRSILEFGGGLYGTATRFAAVSKNLCFGRGEGLPRSGDRHVAVVPEGPYVVPVYRPAA